MRYPFRRALRFKVHLKALNKLCLIVSVVHLFKRLAPDPLIDKTVLHCCDHKVKVRLAFVRVALVQSSLDKEPERVFYLDLDLSKRLIAVILEYLTEKESFVIRFLVHSNCIDDCHGPFDYQRLQSVPLVQISVHVLLQGL